MSTKKGTTWDVTPKRNREFTCESLEQNIPKCKNVTKPYRLLESRSACTWKFLSREIGTKNVYSNMMTIPIITSFMTDAQGKSAVKKCVEAMVNGMFNEDESKVGEKFYNTIVEVCERLRLCNVEWNRKMGAPAEQMYKTLNPHITYLNPMYKETVRNLLFLQEIMGVINKPSFVEGSQYHVILAGKRERFTTIDPAIDELCKHKSPRECENDDRCVFRRTSKGSKECISAQRHRTIRAGDDTSYYVQEVPDKIVYRPKCLYFIISGNAGIFRQYKVLNSSLSETKNISIVFPPFGGNSKETSYGFGVYYWGGYIQNVPAIVSGKASAGNVGVQIGLWRWIESWYSTCLRQMEESNSIDRDNDHIYITGVSLGGALANLASFKLLQLGYKHVHMYACGAPRVGDANFNRYMGLADLEPDSANYIRFTNLVKDNKFYCQFDPICKFPPNQWSFWGLSGYGHLRFVDNPRIRLMGAGLTFNPVLSTFENQPEYDMIPYAKARRMWLTSMNKYVHIGADCESHWGFVHSIGSYSAMAFYGQNIFDGSDSEKPYNDRDYYASYDAIRNMDDVECDEK
jgi:hypothetical protein